MMKRLISYIILIWIGGGLAGCNLPGASQTPGNVEPTSPLQTALPSETPNSPQNSPIVAQPSPTAALETPTQMLSTPRAAQKPTLGPALQRYAAGQKIDITFIHMVDLQNGWAFGGLDQHSDHLFRTQDGGSTWKDVTPPQPAPGPGESNQGKGAFLDASSARVIFTLAAPSPAPPYALIWYTSDGGSSWKYSVLDTSAFQEIFDPLFMDFPDAQHGWLLAALGAGMSHEYVGLFSTQDGGASWSDILDPYMTSSVGDDIQSCDSKTGMVFVDAENGWLTRDCSGLIDVPHIFKTSDGGVSWTRLDLSSPTGDPVFFSSFGCGTFSPNAFGPSSVLFDLRCFDLATFKSEKDFLYSTSDGGGSWSIHPLPAGYALGQGFRLGEAFVIAPGLAFQDVQNGFALGRTIFKTADGGKTWSAGKTVDWDGQFSFVDAAHGWAVAGNNGQIALVQTANGTSSWKEIKASVGP